MRTRLILGLMTALAGTALVVTLAACGDSKPGATATTTAATTTAATTAKGLVLDTSKSYGDKYADGILPVGDGKYKSSAKKGYVFSCQTNYQSNAAGAGSRGPWFINNNSEYDINKKVSVSGKVEWDGKITNAVNGSRRTIVTNDLPESHTTGTFPVQSSDDAYSYDRNPNSIKSQSLVYRLDSNPKYGSPQCMGGESGVMLTGVALFNGFDAGGRDAGAWEVQDSCSGHPQVSGEYHYHTLSSCITDANVDQVIGFALDGFPITGPKVGEKNILTTDDLDECHGITSEVTLDGKKVTTYHYVMTQDFPYSVSCFRGDPINAPGQQGGADAGGGPPGGGPPQ